jgi:coatomer subunit epsilon
LVGIVYYYAEKYDEALELLSSFPQNLECVGLCIQIYIKLNRMDLAQRELKVVKQWADDAAYAQIVS